MRVTHSRKARADLRAIWREIAKDNPDAADRMLDAIGAKARLLADNPALGRLRPDIAPELRYLLVEPYLILYRTRPKDVEVVRVLHGARNLPVLFPGGKLR